MGTHYCSEETKRLEKQLKSMLQNIEKMTENKTSLLTGIIIGAASNIILSHPVVKQYICNKIIDEKTLNNLIQQAVKGFVPNTPNTIDVASNIPSTPNVMDEDAINKLVQQAVQKLTPDLQS